MNGLISSEFWNSSREEIIKTLRERLKIAQYRIDRRDARGQKLEIYQDSLGFDIDPTAGIAMIFNHSSGKWFYIEDGKEYEI